jgi:hypothetical protein
VINCTKSNTLVPDTAEVIVKGERQAFYAMCHYCNRDVRVHRALPGRWRYSPHGDGTSSKNPKTRTNNGNCHRTRNARTLNVVYAAHTAHVGHCRKCGKPFWRTFISQEEHDLLMAEWFRNPPGEAPMPPYAGWTEWEGWSKTNVPYLIKELP